MLDLLFNYKLTAIKTSTQSSVRFTSGLFRNSDNYDMMCAEWIIGSMINGREKLHCKDYSELTVINLGWLRPWTMLYYCLNTCIYLRSNFTTTATSKQFAMKKPMKRLRDVDTQGSIRQKHNTTNRKSSIVQ